MAKTKVFGIDALREAVGAFNHCSETFNQKYSAEELLKIHAVWKLIEWDFPPDEWTSYQLSNALKGVVPSWDTNGQPKSKPRIEELIAESIDTGKRVVTHAAVLQHHIRQISTGNEGDTCETIYYGTRDGKDWTILVRHPDKEDK